MKKIISLLMVLMMLFAMVILSGCSESEEPFRLHIIANSDSEFDQQVKLLVRDGILELTAEDMAQLKSEKEAEKYVTQNIENIVARANEILAENGAEYSARAEIGVFEFPDRVYGEVTYPAGDYYALRLVLGEGEGKNWWCVMFPPLCIVNAGEAAEEDNIVYRSAILDWLKEVVFGVDT